MCAGRTGKHPGDVLKQLKFAAEWPAGHHIALCRSPLKTGLLDRFGVVIFPVITGSTGYDRIYDGYPDVALGEGTKRAHGLSPSRFSRRR
jgi:hypothetical protein